MGTPVVIPSGRRLTKWIFCAALWRYIDGAGEISAVQWDADETRSSRARIRPLCVSTGDAIIPTIASLHRAPAGIQMGPRAGRWHSGGPFSSTSPTMQRGEELSGSALACLVGSVISLRWENTKRDRILTSPAPRVSTLYGYRNGFRYDRAEVAKVHNGLGRRGCVGQSHPGHKADSAQGPSSHGQKGWTGAFEMEAETVPRGNYCLPSEGAIKLLREGEGADAKARLPFRQFSPASRLAPAP